MTQQVFCSLLTEERQQQDRWDYEKGVSTRNHLQLALIAYKFVSIAVASHSVRA